MQKYILQISFFFIGLLACGQTQKNNKYSKKGKLLYSETRTDSIVNAKYFYENVKVEASGKKINGRKIGVWKRYYKNGQIFSIEKYKKKNFISLRTGEWKLYHKNGKLKAIGKYDNGIKMGEWKIFYKNGNLKEIRNYKKEINETKYYRKNGKLRGILLIQNTTIIFKEYDRKGRLKATKKSIKLRKKA